MNKYSHLIILFVSLFLCSKSQAQVLSDALMQNPWKAQWITAPGVTPMNQRIAAYDASLKEYGVYKFRKNFELAAMPASFVVHVSGDNRYKLFVNEQLVSLGPARGDLYFWNFETVDIAKYLQVGKNVVAALVWNDGKQKPEAQISYLTGFILQGNSATEEILNTDNSWKSIKDSSYSPLTPQVLGYYVAGPGELVLMKYNTKNWQQINYDDSKWSSSRTIGHGLTKDAARDSRGWMLVPSPLPPMELKIQRLSALRKADGIDIPASFPATKTAVIIPSNTSVTLLLDQSFLTNAYPTLLFSKGKDAGISLSYAEALYTSENKKTKSGRGKGNRNDIDGKIFIGKKDSIIADGTIDQQYTSLTWRTYRYIQLKITTKDEPLVIDDIYGTFTGYPFVLKTSFESGNDTDKKMLEIGWRTAKLCAWETYMDCPYYEQLQYIGDARIQALVTLYNTNDDRLVRNALTLMDNSRIAEGITLSRYPTDLHQEIPTFSLWWIGMLHDYWMYRPDANFIIDKLPGERQVLSFFQRYQGSDGSLKNVPYWIFSDWVDNRKGWDYGVAPIGKDGCSSVLDLQLMWTYQVAAEMETAIGFKDIAKLYLSKAAQLKQTIQKKYWDKTKQLYADTEEKNLFSQHANSLAILAGMVTGAEAKVLAQHLLTDTFMAQASIYYKYYLHQALIKAGLGNNYKKWLGKWQENIDLGMTTWAEMSDVSGTRSDCHAWGSSPNIEFFRTILGVDSDAPGFAKIKIEPHLGDITHISGSMPHPNGMVSTGYKNEAGKWAIDISLPINTTGRFLWKGKVFPLKAGMNNFNL